MVLKIKKILLIFPEPCRGQSPGLPGTVLDIHSDTSINKFISKLTVNHLKIPLPISFRPLKSPDVYTWNVSLTSTGTNHTEFWKDFSCSVLNHLQAYIGIYCFIGRNIINYKQDLNLKKVTVLRTGSLYYKDAKWDSNQNKFFEILDIVISLRYLNTSTIKWENCFV